MARIVLLSDIHANLNALNAVKPFAAGLNPDDYWVLGDTLGYGPAPFHTWKAVKRLRPAVWLVGNHDWYVAPQDSAVTDGPTMLRGMVCRVGNNGKKTHVDGPHESAYEVDRRHRDALESTDILTLLPDMPCRANPVANIFAAHAAYCAPDGDGDAHVWLENRLASATPMEAVYQFSGAPWHDLPLDEPALHLGGHTHVTACWERNRQKTATDGASPCDLWTQHGPDGQPELEVAYPLQPGCFYHINPGSVGIPRGRVACPTFAMLDTDVWTVTFYSVYYDVEATRTAMQDLDYPPDLYSIDYLQPCCAR